ncbi:putative adhesin [Pantoea sp. A4]|uniref:putative adhesin n=1 Tax=Pantoea sp. A4 TaxID=1225184 RepID=UPI000A9DFB6F|nr:hypothetical protein [Pantoea sp. A4]
MYIPPFTPSTTPYLNLTKSSSTGAAERTLTPAVIRYSMQRAVDQMAQIYHPILDPAAWLDLHIRQQILDFSQRYPTMRTLMPDTKITMVFTPTIRQVVPSGLPRRFPAKAFRFTLHEITTRHYLYTLDSQHPGLQFHLRQCEHQPLVEQLLKQDLQRQMLQALHKLTQSADWRSNIQRHYRQMLVLRCLNLLSRRNAPPEQQQAIMAFLKGEKCAQQAFFHGYPLNGVIYIATGSSEGILLSIDEPASFSLKSRLIADNRAAYIQNYRVTDLPKTSRFQNWVLNKVPLKVRERYLNDPQAFALQHNGAPFWKNQRSLFFDLPWQERRYGSPITFSRDLHLPAVPVTLMTSQIARLKQDIDTLVLTQREIRRDRLLNSLKYSLNFLSMTVSAALPGTGSVLGRVLVMAINAGLAAATTGLAVYQMRHTQRLADAEKLRNEAILSGVCGVLGLGLDAVALKGALKSDFPALLTRFRRVRQSVNRVWRSKRVAQSSLKPARTVDRALSLAPVKPRRKNFALESEYRQAKQAYDKELKQRMAMGHSATQHDIQQRENMARAQLARYGETHPALLGEIEQSEPLVGFSLTSKREDSADSLVLSAHGWFTSHTGNRLLPRGKEMIFLGPHGEKLLEPETALGMLPTVKLLEGSEVPSIYARLINKHQVDEVASAAFSELNAGATKPGFIRNYQLRHYERASAAESKLAVLTNRLKNSGNKMDILTVDPLAGDRKSLADILNAMRPGGSLSHYKRLIFAACREEKRAGSLTSLQGGLGGYEIHFSPHAFEHQPAALLRQRRASNHLAFTGYRLYFTLTLIPDNSPAGFTLKHHIRAFIPWRE